MFKAGRLTVGQEPTPIRLISEDGTPGTSITLWCKDKSIVLCGTDQTLDEGVDWPQGAIYSARLGGGTGARADVVYVASRSGEANIEYYGGGI